MGGRYHQRKFWMDLSRHIPSLTADHPERTGGVEATDETTRRFALIDWGSHRNGGTSCKPQRET